MSYITLSINPWHLDIDIGALEREETFIFEHLKRYCFTRSPFPHLELAVKDGQIEVIQGQEYAWVARHSRGQQVLGIFHGHSLEDLEALDLQGDLQVFPEATPECDRRFLNQFNAPHVIGLADMPTPSAALKITEMINAHCVEYRRVVGLTPWNKDSRVYFDRFERGGPYLDLDLPRPAVDDSPWKEAFSASLADIHRQFVPIVSFDGRRVQCLA